MAKQQSIAEARSNLPSLVREVESGRSVELTRRGQPVAVLIGRQEYVRLSSRHRRFSQAYADFTQDINLKDLAIDPNEIFAGARDEDVSRVLWK